MGETVGRTVEQVRALVGWVGTGRKLTQTGRVTLADARALVEVLDTGDRMDPVIGDRTFKTKSSEELYHLTLLVEWAKAARLLRTAGGRLLPVKKNAKLLEHPDELRGALFSALPHIGPVVTVSGWLESLFTHEYDRGLRALLHRLYAAAAPRGTMKTRRPATQPFTALGATDWSTGPAALGQGRTGRPSVPGVRVLGVDYTATRRTLSPQSFVMSSMSEVSMTTGRR
jgi:hypothetical protein